MSHYFSLVLFQDNVIFERLTKASHYKELTVAHLEQFATEGGEKVVGGIEKWSVLFFPPTPLFFQ